MGKIVGSYKTLKAAQKKKEKYGEKAVIMVRKKRWIVVVPTLSDWALLLKFLDPFSKT